MEAIQKIQYGKHIIEVYHDDLPLNPRNDDNLGTMVCFHKRYDLGDRHEYKHEDYSSWNDMRGDIIRRENAVFISPLFMHDHGAVSISMSDFSDPWDSGQIGFIYVTEEQANGMSEFDIKMHIKKEINIYNNYLNGDVYMYKIFEEEICNLGCAHRTELESGYGYYLISECIVGSHEALASFRKEEVA